MQTGRWRFRRNWRGKMILQIEVADWSIVRTIWGWQRRWNFRWRDATVEEFGALLTTQGHLAEEFATNPSFAPPPRQMPVGVNPFPTGPRPNPPKAPPRKK
ncbi:hypothetical protein [Chromobacterium sp. LK1]|uniref:hypothetical protein n=1 Tax=Chromobacterium sp. LK1 TaxID=1628193 RepID=UPI0012E222C1|nr:hypothetical protein [Chromobacterium sp. LK1]